MIIPVILSGGSGTRLWPLSRKRYPKQFLSLVNKTSLFQDTVMRLPKGIHSPLVVCNEDHRFIVAEQLRQIKSNNNGIVLEPIGRNTAPAITIAALSLLNKNDDPLLLVLSSDHLINSIKKFQSSIKIASQIAEKGKIVTLGIKPDRPETNYGYIEVRKQKKSSSYKINTFLEKPSLEIAEKCVNSGNYFWNSGIFLFKASSYLRELKKFEPEIYKVCKKSLIGSSQDVDFIRLDQEQFKSCPDKSIDYAVMEKTIKGVVVPFSGGWSDIGSWETLTDSKPRDKNNNTIDGDVVLSKVKNSLIHSENRLITVNNLSDIIIIDTADALLVSSKNSAKGIKKIVRKLQNENRNETEHHRKVYRPWGYYELVGIESNFQVRRILVNPGAKLSLQENRKRSEHWVIIKGTALVAFGKKVFKLSENESTYIPKGYAHRLENNEKTPLEIIEIQTESY